jgi:hypothetical protein
LQRDAEIAMGFGVRGPQGNRLTIGGDGFVQLPVVFQRGAQIVVSLGVGGPEGNRPLFSRTLPRLL